MFCAITSPVPDADSCRQGVPLRDIESIALVEEPRKGDLDKQLWSICYDVLTLIILGKMTDFWRDMFFVGSMR